MPRRPLAALLLLAAAGCHKTAPAPGGVSQEDAQALNNAADMLDTSADDLTVPTNGPDRENSASANAE